MRSRRTGPLLWAVVSLTVAAVVALLLPSLLLTDVNGLDANEGSRSWQRGLSNFFSHLRQYGFSVIISMIGGGFAYHMLAWRRGYAHIISPTRDFRVTAVFMPASAIVVLVTLGTVWWASSIDPSQSFWVRLANNPGGFFAIVTGILSLIGIYLTLENVWNVRSSIVTFSDYVDRVDKLIKGTAHGDYVRMMVHTPATGCLVLPSSIWMKLSKTMQDDGSARISLTCLGQSEMMAWFESYKTAVLTEDLPLMQERIDEGLEQSARIKSDTQKRTTKETGDLNQKLALIEASWDQLPQYYMVANSRQAIVAVPFFLPKPNENIFAGSVHNRPVQMIGFETKDLHIVDSVLQEIETRRNAITASVNAGP